jgi:hypothetical protein
VTGQLQLQIYYSLAKQNSLFTVNGQSAALVNGYCDWSTLNSPFTCQAKFTIHRQWPIRCARQWLVVTGQLQIHHSLAEQNSPFTVNDQSAVLVNGQL